MAADLLIRQVDSANTILHVRIGETFPVTTEIKWTEHFDTVDVQKQMTKIEEERIEEHQEQDEKERQQLVDREKRLLKENKEILSGEYKENPLEVYTRLNVARAQLKWTKADLEQKIEDEIKPGIEKRSKEIAQMDKEHPTFRSLFFEKYAEARREACLSNDIPVDHLKVQQGFLKYLVEDKD